MYIRKKESIKMASLCLLKMEKKMREKWVDNIKFLAAGGVFLCHYTESFAVEGAGIPQWLQCANKFPFGMIINGEFWVCVFAILSGYLLNKKIIRSRIILIKTCINRYFRFVIPFFFANFFVYVLYNVIGFSAQKCGIVINNNWLLKQYINPIEFISVVKNSIMLGSELNNNFWIIRHMLLGSWLIYISNYICYRLNNKKIKIVVAIGLLLFPYTFFIGAVYAGSLLENITAQNKLTYQRGKVVLICFWVMVGLMSGIQNIVAEILKIRWLYINQYWEIFYAISMLGCIRFETKLLKKFDNFHIDKISKQSLTIYLLHWPIICSFSTWCFMELMRRYNSFHMYYWVTLGITVIILEIMVYCYDKVFGRISNTLLKTITFR